MLHKGFRIDDYLPTEVLLRIFHDPRQPREKRWAALLALGSKGDGETYAVIQEALTSPDAQLRRYALEAMVRHPRAREAEPALLALLFDLDDHVRQTACKVCGQLGLESAHDGILQLLKSESPEIRDVALNTLGHLWREPDFERVFDLYRHDGRRTVRIAAAKTLRSRASARTWRKLFGAWSVDREARHRLWSCELASQFGGRADVPVVRPLLDDRNRNVRIAAERSLRVLTAS
ncbi:MAG: HEAT repeat domain-containing protein [Candidatus Hydrogenedentes bacterium]|nr:HEAT repeat domain-containing protein [Candidatus Hydrogenedentota bacterium]